MGQQRMGPPAELVLGLARHLGIRSFVETGTYRGDTAAWAAEHFDRVTTIELSPSYHAAAAQRFASSEGRVQAVQGNSARTLAALVPELQEPALFWLDAHWSGLDTAGREAECPLLEEVAAINAGPQFHVVLVDDARLFCAPPPPPHRAADWPDLCATVNALENGGRRYVVLVEDVFVAVPQAARAFLIEWMQASVGKAGRSSAPWWRRFA